MGPTEFLLVVAVGGGIIAVLFATFMGAASEADEDVREEAAGAAEPGTRRAELEERLGAMTRSLEEIEADHAAGDLLDADYEPLRRRYEREAETLRLQLADAGDAPVESEPRQSETSARGGSRMTGVIGWSAATIAFVALAWLVMSQALRPRGVDDTITGSLPGQEMGSAAGVPVADVDADRLAALGRMVAEDSTNVEALVELAHMYLALQRYGEVTVLTLKALEYDPQNPEALTHMGMVLFTVEHPDRAIESFDRALEIDPAHGEALQFKGMVAFMGGDYVTAVGAWERYLEVVPEEEQSPRIRGMLEMARANAGSAQTP
jgi:cytochrome c-type biogenesis protein CcmH/NrfG